MLHRIKDLPQHVAGIHAVGNVGEREYNGVLIPALDEKVEEFGAIYYLLVLETHVSHFKFSAWYRDLKLMLRYYFKWKKIAIVTDREGVEWFKDVFKYLIPGKCRHFPLDKLDEAIIWVSEK
jgi:hypothetical protein